MGKRLSVKLEADVDRYGGLVSTRARATVIFPLGANPDDIEEQSEAGYIFVPDTANGEKLNRSNELVNAIDERSWVAAALIEFLEGHPGFSGKIELVGSMEY